LIPTEVSNESFGAANRSIGVNVDGLDGHKSSTRGSFAMAREQLFLSPEDRLGVRTRQLRVLRVCAGTEWCNEMG